MPSAVSTRHQGSVGSGSKNEGVTSNRNRRSSSNRAMGSPINPFESALFASVMSPTSRSSPVTVEKTGAPEIPFQWSSHLAAMVCSAVSASSAAPWPRLEAKEPLSGWVFLLPPSLSAATFA